MSQILNFVFLAAFLDMSSHGCQAGITQNLHKYIIGDVKTLRNISCPSHLGHLVVWVAGL